MLTNPQAAVDEIEYFLAAQAVLGAVTDDEIRETAELCKRFGVPVKHAARVAAILAVCNPDGTS